MCFKLSFCFITLFRRGYEIGYLLYFQHVQIVISSIYVLCPRLSLCSDLTIRIRCFFFDGKNSKEILVKMARSLRARRQSDLEMGPVRSRTRRCVEHVYNTLNSLINEQSCLNSFIQIFLCNICMSVFFTIFTIFHVIKKKKIFPPY